jgi:dTDP-glucose pyrophosphorylase
MVVPTQALEQCIIDLTSTIREALASLDESSAKLVVVTDEKRKVVGIMTDGDVRRALLRGATLEDPVLPHVKKSFTYVDARASRADVLDLMQARSVGEVPILDAGGHLVGLHRMHDVLARKQRDNCAVVMAGGKGTRLGTLTESMPKPMLKVAGRPILERIVLHLAGVGIQHIYLAINYLGHVVEEHFGDGSRFGCRIEYLREPKALGTAGALSLLPQKPTKPVLVMNGDLVTQTDFADMLDFHERHGQAVTVGVRRYLHTVPFGCFELDGDNVISVEEKPAIAKVINAGIYVLSPEMLERVPQDREFTMPDLLGDAMGGKKGVVAYEIEGDWVDVGRVDQLRKARGEDA